MTTAGFRNAGGDWSAGYLKIGSLLGVVAAGLTFLGAWFACTTTASFLGFLLGWIPAALLAWIVFWITTYGWGLIALGALAIGIYASNQGRNSQPAPVVSVAPDSAPLATPARDLQIEPPPQAPPPPSSDAATRAILAFRTAYAAKGFAGAVTLTMDCYGKLEAASSWEGWDYCASIDEIAQAANQSSQNPVDFFAANSVRARQSTAGNAIKWGAADGDRIAALKVILSQAAQEKAASEKAALEAALHQPSFDCSKVTSENLKLICSTPDLADADQLMASAYSAATFAVTDKAVLRASQREWVRRRNSEPPIVPTLLALYADRIAQLKALSLQTPTSP